MVARVGVDANPPIPSPKPLRPLLGFARLPDRALVAVKQVLDNDEEFRSHVALAANEGELGRASYLYLTRPDGWEKEIAELEAAAAEEASSVQEEQEERSARRRLRGAEQAAQRAEQALQKARADMAQSAGELAAERRARRTAEDLLASLRARLAAIEAERDSSRAATRAAKEEAKGANDRLIAVQRDRDRLRQELVRRESEARPSIPPAPVPAAAPEVDVAAVAEAVGAALDAAERLDRALAAASAALEAAPNVAPAVTPAGVAPGADEAAVRSVARPARRLPARLPPAVFEDSVEAADYLVRLNGMLIVVDGYNVSFLAWPQLPVADQRRRLVDALGELVARTGAAVQVVFDGAEGSDLPPSSSARPLVRTTFSPGGVDADEVIIDQAASLPAGQPVVVATSDRRVQDEVRRRGANVISSAQLLGVLGRSAGPA
jgi:predicted RNA-binding protein with PIN domain